MEKLLSFHHSLCIWFAVCVNLCHIFSTHLSWSLFSVLNHYISGCNCPGSAEWIKASWVLCVISAEYLTELSRLVYLELENSEQLRYSLAVAKRWTPQFVYLLRSTGDILGANRSSHTELEDWRFNRGDRSFHSDLSKAREDGLSVCLCLSTAGWTNAALSGRYWAI